MKLLVVAVLVVCFAFGKASEDKWDRIASGLADMIEGNATMLAMWQDHVRLFRDRETRVSRPFKCHLNLIPLEAPESVHELRMEDFKVIGAMGDSLTSANGAKAKTWFTVRRQYRGVSWSIGGDDSFDSGSITLANILRKYNPDIRGYSTGQGDVNSAGAHLNVAYPGNKARHMPKQADLLIQRIKEDTHINFQDNWKLVTLFIGGNDLCDVCEDEVRYSAENYIKHVRDALDKLHTGLPRTFVNLAMIFDITPIASLGGFFNVFCKYVHQKACVCGEDKAHHAIVQKHLVEYQRLTQELIDSGRYDTKDDFTVVIQPFYKDTVPPDGDDGKPDLSYFALDCFHFSTKGHQVAAISLFNNMVEPVGHKSTRWHRHEPFLCPGQHEHHVNDFIPTYKNHQPGFIGK